MAEHHMLPRAWRTLLYVMRAPLDVVAYINSVWYIVRAGLNGWRVTLARRAQALLRTSYNALAMRNIAQ